MNILLHYYMLKYLSPCAITLNFIALTIQSQLPGPFRQSSENTSNVFNIGVHNTPPPFNMFYVAIVGASATSVQIMNYDKINKNKSSNPT